MSILGNRVLRVEDPKFLTVGGTYMADLRDALLAGAAHVTFVRSTVAHAHLRVVNVDDAQAAPGVLGVFIGADVEIGPLPPPIAMLNQSMTRPLLATDSVRFVGEPIAAIVTEQPEQGADAAELVWAEYEPLPTLVDPEGALTTDTVLFPAVGTNVALDLSFGRTDDLFDGCEVVVTQRVVNQRVAACPLEPRGAAAAWADGRLHLWVSTQSPHEVRDALLKHYDMAAGTVRVAAPDVGGGFGPKIGAGSEELLLPWLARQVGRPVRWAETRSENLVAMGQGRGQVQTVEIGGTRDGRVEAYRLTILQDSGAYPAMGGILPYLTRVMVTGVYDIARVECNATSVVTNTTPTTAYRGAGRPEATAAIERAMDLFAAEIGKDPVRVRRRNLVPANRFPYTTAVGTVYDVGDYERALDLAVEVAGYRQLRDEQDRRRRDGDRVQLGIGVSVYVEITAGPTPDGENAGVTVHEDGTAIVRTGTSPHGQGHATAWAMIASEETGIPIDRIAVVHGDTDLVPQGGGTMGSRSLQLGGSAVYRASVELVERAREAAADLLEAHADDVVLDKVSGRFHVAGTPAVAKTWGEVAATTADGLVVDARFDAPQPTFPFGAHIAVVEVDTETGEVILRRLVAVDDAGRILTPMLAEGQLHGGIAQGAAQALCEEVRWDADGNPITSNLADYAMISAAELPSFELVPMETPTPVNPLGAKGIGESGTIGSTPAVHGAVIDALAHLGIRHLDMPCSPERVWQAMRSPSGPPAPA